MSGFRKGLGPIKSGLVIGKARKQMRRRSFLKGAGVSTAAVIASNISRSAPAIANERIQWKMVTLWPKNFPGLGTGSQRIADAIREMSNGKLDIKVYGAGELVPAYEAFDAVREGIAECMHEAPYIWIAKHPAMAFFCGMPGGLTPQEHNGRGIPNREAKKIDLKKKDDKSSTLVDAQKSKDTEKKSKPKK